MSIPILLSYREQTTPKPKKAHRWRFPLTNAHFPIYTCDSRRQHAPYMKAQSVELETTQGKIKFKLFPEVAPKACENFATHVKNGYYDGVIFHRVITDFMIQGGDPKGTGTGGESIWGEPFEDECSADLRFDRPGLLAMANAGPSTNGSQFFITCAPTPWLNNRHTIFGEVQEGMEIVRKIESCQTGAGDRPVEEQKILGGKTVED